MATGDYTFQITLNYAVPNFVSLLTFPIVKYQSDMKGNAELYYRWEQVLISIIHS